jgi:hypothetical protein
LRLRDVSSHSAEVLTQTQLRSPQTYFPASYSVVPPSQPFAVSYPLSPAPCPLHPAFNTRDRHHKPMGVAMLLYLCSRRNPEAWRENGKTKPFRFFIFLFFYDFHSFFEIV